MLDRIGLGTAQLGMEYGVANSTGQPGRDDGLRIVDRAVSKGISLLDTARAYGDSEAVLGAFMAGGKPKQDLRIVSKLPGSADHRMTVEHFLSGLRGSLRTLGTTRLYAWLVHDAQDVVRERHAFEAAAEEAKESGLTEKVGISIYGWEDLNRIESVSGIDIVQLPLSILDQRLLRSGHIDDLRSHGVEIHARSLFLQGLVLMSAETVPVGLSSLRPGIERLRRVAAELGLTPYELSLAFAHTTPQVDYWIIGAETVDQVEELTRRASIATRYSDRASGLAFADLAVEDCDLMDPRKWRRA